VHIVRKVCIDRGEVTSGNLKRDNIEPSSTKVKGVHRKEICFKFREDKTTGSSVEALLAGHRASEKSAQGELSFDFRGTRSVGERHLQSC
jgi:hypothetical protein